jgi:hypothetical protein
MRNEIGITVMEVSRFCINPETASGEFSFPHCKSFAALSQASIPPEFARIYEKYMRTKNKSKLVRLEQKLKVEYMSISFSTSPAATVANSINILSACNFPF